MAMYLLMLHDLDQSAELVVAADELQKEDRTAEFVLLVPATPVPTLDALLEPSFSPTRFARRRAQRVRDRLLAAGLHLLATRLGNFDPVRAVEDALRFTNYAAVVVATPEHKLLHLVHCDLPCRLARRFPQTRVIHASTLLPPPATRG
ncbi:MAG: hypothetical protein ACREMY_07295 [bacterium]